MSLLEKYSTSSNNLVLIPYNFPQLKDDRLYSGIRVEKKKKELISELVSLNLVFDQSYYFEQNFLESRFWLSNSLSSEKLFNYTFKFIDLSTKTFIFDSKRKKLLSSNSLVFLYNLRKYILLNNLKKKVVKNRFLFANKKGYAVSCFGKQAFLTRNIFFNKVKQVKKFPYSLWYIYNLNLLGKLTSFFISKWEVKKQIKSKKSNASNFVKKYTFYYKKNYTLKSIINLKKK